MIKEAIKKKQLLSFKVFLKKQKNIENIEIFKYLESRKHFKKETLNKKFESEKEFYEFFQQEVFNFLTNEYLSLKEKISTLRKKGTDVTYEEMKTMSIPLKIKLFNASFKKSDFDKTIKIIELVKKNLNKYPEKN